MAAALDAAFERAAPVWLDLARTLGQSGDARLAHAPSAAGTISDLGLMLAWTLVVGDLAAGSEDVAVVCDDPWLFRHLAALPGVRAEGEPPPLHRREYLLALRGLASRLRVGLRMAMAAIALRRQRRLTRPGTPVLLVYGHPASRTDGFDAYFGPLMQNIPSLGRMLHVDCLPERARALEDGGRTLSLHGFGSPLYALTRLWSARWRPRCHGPHSWLLRRAAALESGGGQAAMIRWQIHCQRRWLDAAKPAVVAWPWENHGWERDFAAACRRRGIATIGCQHATIGRHELNHAAHSLNDPALELPDRISAVGPAAARRLAEWGIPASHLVIGGVWRFAPAAPLPFDPAGPVFLALPAQTDIARQMIAAGRRLGAADHRVLVREHPMTPVGFKPEPGMEAASGSLPQVGAVRAVVFAATTVGLEALLAGLPVVRFLPEGILANDILPDRPPVPAADAEGLAEAVVMARPVAGLAESDVFIPAGTAAWRQWLTGGTP
ncbi:hypothetical protein H261_07793 [Paramagnetospirillum caucaseum]|uniref:Uncharacterized protein n=2 Tax=Paramagnetospirillum caucaseum TaxID=1244869 RepID=M2Z882_9PROT|nr:hypothetical protein H261_07793 [Paramagnetospirillum caucaseum]